MSGNKLLVADDSLTIQKVIRLALSSDGYEIQTVSEGNEAIEQILLFRPKVVLIDVSLPGKSAVEVKSAIDSKPDLAGTHFILMSSAFETVDEAAVTKAGFTARLTKPFDPAHLRKLVSEGLGASSGAAVSVPPFPPMQDLEPAASVRTPPPAPPLAPAAALGGDESDIRQLTQSTLKMAGLDDLDWSIQEPSSKGPPAGAPPAFGADSLSLPPLPGFSASQPEAFAPPSLTPPGFQPSNAAAAAYFAAPAVDDLPPPVPSQPSEPQAYALPTDELEALVRQQIEDAIAKVSREMLPQIAERIIKQEINRLLNEVP